MNFCTLFYILCCIVGLGKSKLLLTQQNNNKTKINTNDETFGGCLIDAVGKYIEFHNPNYPEMDNRTIICTLNIKIYDQDVCQVRVDFNKFDIDQPTNGDCLGDRFRVTTSAGTPVVIPTLCGRNHNQHIYVHIPSNNDITERSVSLLFDTNNIGDYMWHITVNQINCHENHKDYPDQPIMAPESCLQYFITPHGLLESFNYGLGYLNNMDYDMCIHRQIDTCRVTYNANDNEFGVACTDAGKLFGRSGDTNCVNDYLVIESGSRDGKVPTYDRYCGNRLHYAHGSNTSAPVVSKANGPIAVRFRSDSSSNKVCDGLGFRVCYEQSSTDC